MDRRLQFFSSLLLITVVEGKAITLSLAPVVDNNKTGNGSLIQKPIAGKLFKTEFLGIMKRESYNELYENPDNPKEGDDVDNSFITRKHDSNYDQLGHFFEKIYDVFSNHGGGEAESAENYLKTEPIALFDEDVEVKNCTENDEMDVTTPKTKTLDSRKNYLFRKEVPNPRKNGGFITQNTTGEDNLKEYENLRDELYKKNNISRKDFLLNLLLEGDEYENRESDFSKLKDQILRSDKNDLLKLNLN